MTTRLVVFDLGRVMIRLVDGWQHACERAGMPYKPGLDSPAHREGLLRLIYLNEVGRLTPEAWCNATAEITGLTPGQVQAVSDAWLMGPFPGWDALLDHLGAAPVKTACLSNTNASHWALMTAPEGANHLPLDRLHYRFASHIVGAHKPEAAIYEYVEAATHVAPADIVFFDDSAPNVAAAQSRGWKAHVIDTAADPVSQIAAVLEREGVL